MHYLVTRWLSVIVNDWVEEVTLVSTERVTSHSVLAKNIITVENSVHGITYYRYTTINMTKVFWVTGFQLNNLR